MNQWLNKMERKFGRFAIPDLTRYLVGLYTLGAILGMAYEVGLLKVDVYYTWLCLDLNAVLHGQIWRLFTFLIEPYGFSTGASFLINVIFFLVQVNLFFLFGRSLEQAWGTFRYNLYILSGYLLNILAAILLFASPLHIEVYYSGFQYIYWAMFFAFALISPDTELLFYFVLPIKVKWLALLDAAFMLYQIFSHIRSGIYYMSVGISQYYQAGLAHISMAVAIIVAMANFLLFFFMTRNYGRFSSKNVKRRRDFQRRSAQASWQGVRHQCAICGRTSDDSPDLEFRYCSKCEGNYEYCSEHLFTHQHVKKFM